MKYKRYLIIIFLVLPIFTSWASERELPPIISAQMLKESITSKSVVVLDVRKVEEFKNAHIPGSICLTCMGWQTVDRGLDCQLPPKDDLEELMCYTGIKRYKHVVIVGKPDTDFNRANITRVAWTIKYAGHPNPLILDGGFDSWLSLGYPVEKDWRKPEKCREKCHWNEDVLAKKEDVLRAIEKGVVIDARLPSLFSGKEVDPMTKKRGHIPHTINLPYTLIYKDDGKFEDAGTLRTVVRKFIGDDKEKEIIILCCNGRFATSWWFILSEVLGYKKVKVYDGSMEEWCKDGGPLSDQ